MGKIAERYCRKIFVTDDNPRNENPKKIREEIIKGCKKNVKNIGNRRMAIYEAIKELKANELLLVAGKGHEITQDYGKKIINFSDKEAIKNIIKEGNWSTLKNINKKNIKSLINLNYKKFFLHKDNKIYHIFFLLNFL